MEATMIKMLIAEAYGQNGYIKISKNMLKKLGYKNSIFLSYLIDIWAYNQYDDFYATYEKITDELGFNDKTSKKIIDYFISQGVIIKKEFKGLPPKQYYNIDYKKLMELLLENTINTIPTKNDRDNLEVGKNTYLNPTKNGDVKDTKNGEDIYKNKYIRINNNSIKSKSNDLSLIESPQASATQKVCEAQTQTEPKTEAELKPIDFEIPASLFEKQKKETPAEKYQNAMRQFLDFKQANPTCPISQEQWSEWLVACIKKNGSKFSYTAQTKSLKKSLTLNSAYVKEQIDKAIAGNWQGLNLNEAESKKYDRLEVYNANKPTSRQEQLEKGLSGIASYENKEPQEYLELVDSELNGAVPYDWLDFSYEIRIEKLRELKRQRLARERM